MRLTLIHNPQAGDESRSADVLREMLADAGYDVTCESTKKAWKKALKRPTDLAVAAGGDGTVRKVALVLGEHEHAHGGAAAGDGEQRRQDGSRGGGCFGLSRAWAEGQAPAV